MGMFLGYSIYDTDNSTTSSLLTSVTSNSLKESSDSITVEILHGTLLD